MGKQPEQGGFRMLLGFREHTVLRNLLHYYIGIRQNNAAAEESLERAPDGMTG